MTVFLVTLAVFIMVVAAIPFGIFAARDLFSFGEKRRKELDAEGKKYNVMTGIFGEAIIFDIKND